RLLVLACLLGTRRGRGPGEGVGRGGVEAGEALRDPVRRLRGGGGGVGEGGGELGLAVGDRRAAGRGRGGHHTANRAGQVGDVVERAVGAEDEVDRAFDVRRDGGGRRERVAGRV